VFLALAEELLFPRTVSVYGVSDVCVGRKRQSPCLVQRSPEQSFSNHANRARARASPAPHTPAGWLCMAWLEGFEVDDVVEEDTTVAALRELVGDVVVGVLEVDVDVDVAVVRGVVVVVVAVSVVVDDLAVEVSVEISVEVAVSVEVSVPEEVEEVPVASLQRAKKYD